jgi:hypothetical protein
VLAAARLPGGAGVPACTLATVAAGGGLARAVPAARSGRQAAAPRARVMRILECFMLSV